MTNGQSHSTRRELLHKQRPRSRFMRISFGLAAGLILWAWLAEAQFESLLTPEQKRANIERFLDKLTPEPVRSSGDWSAVFPWLTEKLTTGHGLVAVAKTFALSAFSISLAGFFACIILPAAARNLATIQPLGIKIANHRVVSFLWTASSRAWRILFVMTRSIPEYVLGFLLISVIGPDPWALVLALAIHNWGVLGRLGAEVIENAPPEAGQTVLSHGGGRIATFITTLLPESFNRLIVYLFYRWETCVREATVLGMLGIVSLGYLVVEAKSSRSFDDMILFILLGALLVLIGDLTSALVRRRLRRSAGP